MTNEEIESIEISRYNATLAVAKGEALKRLLDNPDYKLVISEGFFKEYPTEIALAIAGNTGAYDADALAEQLKGINVLKGYEFRVAGNHDAGLQDLKAIEDYIAKSVQDELNDSSEDEE